jgi:hypothetical protein
MRGARAKTIRKAAARVALHLPEKGVKQPHKYFRGADGVIRCPARMVYQHMKQEHMRRVTNG